LAMALVSIGVINVLDGLKSARGEAALRLGIKQSGLNATYDLFGVSQLHRIRLTPPQPFRSVSSRKASSNHAMVSYHSNLSDYR
jgi:hypothetical protein